MFPQVVKVSICSKLCITKSFACPNLVHKASSSITTPRASAISFLVVSVLLSPIPDTKGLDGAQLIALCGSQPSGGEVVGGQVEGAQPGQGFLGVPGEGQGEGQGAQKQGEGLPGP